MPDPSATPQIADSLLDLVGDTPLLRLNRVAEGLDCTVAAKLEMLNPGGSVKDRPALAMIEQAEREGALRPGGTIVEPTSGNTGVGLAIVAAERGYDCIFVVTDKVAPEKIRLLEAYGADVVIPGSSATEFVRSVPGPALFFNSRRTLPSRARRGQREGAPRREGPPPPGPPVGPPQRRRQNSPTNPISGSRCCPCCSATRRWTSAISARMSPTSSACGSGGRSRRGYRRPRAGAACQTGRAAAPAPTFPPLSAPGAAE